MKKKLPVGIQTFEKIIKENYLYIDKTKIIYKLITQGSVYFLSRPRRFGKSLLISTLQDIFKAKKELFKGLYIKEKSDWKWDKYPVIKLSFTSVEVENKSDYRQYIINQTNYYGEKYNIELKLNSFEHRFAELVKKLSKKYNKVVFLVDEYDKPILKHITNLEKVEEMKSVMNDFYSSVKDLDPYLKFVFITGVSKFSKVSVFSGMNNLTDISVSNKYSTLLGITQKELEFNFKTRIKDTAQKLKTTQKELLEKIKYWYNGYYFSENTTSVYNPFSTLHFFNEQKFANYWFTSATPTFLINLIKKNQYKLYQLEHLELSSSSFEVIEPKNMKVEPLLLQTGYLTIKSYDEKDMLYTVDFPNYEVKSSFINSIIESYSNNNLARPLIIKIRNAVNNNDLETFFELMKEFFYEIPSSVVINLEKYYQTLFYAILVLLGLEIEVETHTNRGRIDCIIKTKTHIYIIEFKLNGTAKQALQQIKEKEYAKQYEKQKNKTIILIGVEFNRKERNIGKWIIE